MCGIIFGANIQREKKEAPKPVNDWVVSQFEDQFKRGTEGFGLIFIQKDGEYKVERACEPYKMLIDIRDKKNQAPIVLMHHRTPTSSQNKMQETHPILVDNGSLKYKYLGVHNGVVKNDNEMKIEHEKLGFVYTTQRKTSFGKEEFNDTECLIIELARYIENQTKELSTQRGGAFTILQIDKETDKVKKVFYGRTSESFPLKMAKDSKKIRISSEGEGNDVAIETLYSFAINDFKIEKRKLTQKAEETTIHYDWCQHNNYDYSKDATIINGYKQDDKPTAQNQMEAIIEDIYEKVDEANEKILDNLNLYEEENDLTERINDEFKIMELDAKKEALRIGSKIYNAVKDCQANFMEGMIKEEKAYSMFPGVVIKDKEDQDINNFTPSQGILMDEDDEFSLDTKELNTH